jgi:enamine deaminase RidA (YjgF/YER057c/UK114 family)
MLNNSAFTQVVAVHGAVRTVYIGAQTGVDGSGNIVGPGDIAAQTAQALENMQLCLESAGAKPEHLVRWTIYIADGQPVQAPFEVAMHWWANRPNPPANTVVHVSSLVPPQFLIGIEAIAVVPE